MPHRASPHEGGPVLARSPEASGKHDAEPLLCFPQEQVRINSFE